MESFTVNIINPKAKKLLKDLEDLDLIQIRENNSSNYLKLLKRIRSKAKNGPTLEEITEEVERVRSKNYAEGSTTSGN
jgi:hypothetical protein